MQKIDRSVRHCLLLQLIVVILSVGGVQAEGIQARYLENSGKRSVLEIRIEDPPPSSVIVKQHLPPEQSMKNTLPAYSKHNKKKNVVTWLFKRPAPGVKKIVTQYTSPLAGKGATAVIRCKSPSDGSLMIIRVE